MKRNYAIASAASSPTILEGFVELDDIGVVQHLHDDHLRTYRATVTQKVKGTTWTSNMPSLLFDILYIRFGNLLDSSDGLAAHSLHQLQV